MRGSGHATCSLPKIPASPFERRRPRVPRDQRADRQDQDVDYEINGLTDQLKHANPKAEECQIAIGQHLNTIKAARPDDWEDIVKAECNLGRTRAYELMAISGGTKTVEQTRAQTNIRKIKHRNSVRSGTVGGILIAAIDEGRRTATQPA